MCQISNGGLDLSQHFGLINMMPDMWRTFGGGNYDLREIANLEEAI